MADKGFRILALDIETRPAKAYVWKFWDENISSDQVIESSGILCVGARWVGEETRYFFSEWYNGHKEMLQEIHSLMADADAVITYNGDKFDLPKLQGEFLLYGLEPLPPLTSIDVYKAVKKFGFGINKLSFIGPFLSVGEKIKHQGFSLWVNVMNGDKKARDKMEEYCIQDVDLLIDVYNKIKPFIKNHPHLGKVKGQECGNCGSHKLQSRGVRRTKGYSIQRLQCQSCGAWQDGKREKV